MSKTAADLTGTERDALLKTLAARFAKHAERHKGMAWADVEKRLTGKPGALRTLRRMEETGGEPDVAWKEGAAYVFVDCAEQSPKGRRSLCYDEKARASRKDHPPKGSALCMAEDMGVELLTEEEYRRLQALGAFDTTTSSWIQTPAAIRSLGGALFCDCRYDAVFLYHNGAESYYAARGFRARLLV